MRLEVLPLQGDSLGELRLNRREDDELLVRVAPVLLVGQLPYARLGPSNEGEDLEAVAQRGRVAQVAGWVAREGQ